ncbi:hypothetical protein HN446_02410 [bacterium]|nr:hypothetical protein [bacterium]
MKNFYSISLFLLLLATTPASCDSSKNEDWDSLIHQLQKLAPGKSTQGSSSSGGYTDSSSKPKSHVLLEQILDSLNNLEKNHKDLSGTIQKMESDLLDHRGSLDQAIFDQTKLTKSIQNLEGKIEKVTKEQSNDIATRYDKIETTTTAIKGKLDKTHSIVEEIGKTKEKIEKNRNDLQDQKEKVDTIKNQVATMANVIPEQVKATTQLKKSIDAQKKKIDEIDPVIAKTTQQLATHKMDIRDLKVKAEASSANLNGAGNAISGLKEIIGQTAAEHEKTKNDIASLKNNVTNLVQSHAGLDDHISDNASTFGSKMDSHAQQLDTHVKKIATIDGKTEQLTDITENLTTAASKQNTKVQALSKQILATNGKVDSTQQKLTDLAGVQVQAFTNTKENSHRLSGIENQSNILAKATTDIKNKTDKNTAAIDINKHQADMLTQVTTEIKNKINENTAAVYSATSGIEKADKKITDLKEQFGQKIESANHDAKATKVTIQAITDVAENLTSATAKTRDTIKDHETKLSDLNSNLENTHLKIYDHRNLIEAANHDAKVTKVTIQALTGVAENLTSATAKTRDTIKDHETKLSELDRNLEQLSFKADSAAESSKTIHEYTSRVGSRVGELEASVTEQIGNLITTNAMLTTNIKQSKMDIATAQKMTGDIAKITSGLQQETSYNSHAITTVDEKVKANTGNIDNNNKAILFVGEKLGNLEQQFEQKIDRHKTALEHADVSIQALTDATGNIIKAHSNIKNQTNENKSHISQHRKNIISNAQQLKNLSNKNNVIVESLEQAHNKADSAIATTNNLKRGMHGIQNKLGTTEQTVNGTISGINEVSLVTKNIGKKLDAHITSASKEIAEIVRKANNDQQTSQKQIDQVESKIETITDITENQMKGLKSVKLGIDNVNNIIKAINDKISSAKTVSSNQEKVIQKMEINIELIINTQTMMKSEMQEIKNSLGQLAQSHNGLYKDHEETKSAMSSVAKVFSKAAE